MAKDEGTHREQQTEKSEGTDQEQQTETVAKDEGTCREQQTEKPEGTDRERKPEEEPGSGFDGFCDVEGPSTKYGHFVLVVRLIRMLQHSPNSPSPSRWHPHALIAPSE